MPSILEQAGVRKAKAVIVTTSDDLTNLDIALAARDLNATARIVIRLFDETLARKVAGAFAMPTISTSQVAAPAFIAAATRPKVYQGFQLAGQYVHLTDLTICPDRQARRPDRGRDPGGQADQHRHAPGAAGRERQPRRRHRAGAERHDPRHRPGELLLKLEAMNNAAEQRDKRADAADLAVK